METIKEKLRTELLNAQEKGYKISVQKIIFVTALLGLGSVRIKDLIEFYPILYLAPLVAILFDIQEMGQKFTVRRMGAFLRICSEDPMEQKWENFVKTHRENFFKYADVGFTASTFLLSFLLLAYVKGQCSSIRSGNFFGDCLINGLCKLNGYEIIWFIFLITVYVGLRLKGQKLHKEMDNLEMECSDIEPLGK